MSKQKLEDMWFLDSAIAFFGKDKPRVCSSDSQSIRRKFGYGSLPLA
jgi:hypothetical protein